MRSIRIALFWLGAGAVLFPVTSAAQGRGRGGPPGQAKKVKADKPGKGHAGKGRGKPAHAGKGKPAHAGQRGKPAHAGKGKPAHAGQRGKPAHAKKSKKPKASKARGKMIGRDKIGLETRKHMRRSAKIDRIAAIAEKTNNAKLLEKVQRLRDQEAKRHAKVRTRLAKNKKDDK